MHSTRSRPSQPSGNRMGDESAPGMIPIPVAVCLNNLFPPHDLESLTTATNAKPKWFRPQHTSKLLHRARLEIVIMDHKTDDDCTVLYSAESPSITVHPRWNHLEECLGDFLNNYYYNYEQQPAHLSSPQSSSGASTPAFVTATAAMKSLYRKLRMRFYLIEEANPKSEDDATNENASDEHTSHDGEQGFILEIEFYPTKLTRISKEPTDLPINFPVLYFSDQSIRIPNSFLSIIDKDGTLNKIHSDNFDIFEDDVFRTLDQVMPMPSSAGTTSPYRDEDNLQQQHYFDETLHFETNSNKIAPYGSLHVTPVKTTPVEHYSMMTPTQSQQLVRDLFADHYSSHGDSEDDIRRQHKQLQIRLLEERIAQEEAHLQSSIQSLQEEKQGLQQLIKHTQTLEEENLQLEKEKHSLEIQAQQTEFFCEARRMVLIRNLYTVYPITLLSEHRLLIRDLRLPRDVHSNTGDAGDNGGGGGGGTGDGGGTVSEEEISAALGYLCHLVAMMSKYLNVNLRYRLYCNSSRSAIQEDMTVYPLFQGRAVDRDQLDRGMLLLGRNIESLLKARDIPFLPNEHVLIKMKRIYDNAGPG